MTNTANLDTTNLATKVTNPPVYSGPKEVLLGKPVILKGSYDASRIAKLTIRAEDKFSLPVTLKNGTWEVNMPKGFSSPGARWFRVQGFDSAGKQVESRIFYMTVSRDPLTVAQALTLKVLRDTYFKASSQDSSKLNNQQKVLVKAGQIFHVNRYGSMDAHLKLELAESIEPIGSFGYFYEAHVQLSKGTQVLRFTVDDVPDTPGDGIQMLVTTTTFLKKSREDSSALPDSQKAQLMQGQTLQIKGYACLGGHFRVTLATPIAGFGDVGFIYWRHVRLTRLGQEIPFDPDALTARILQDTVLKKSPVDSSKLAAEDKVSAPAGRVYGVSSYTIEGGHIKLSTTEEFPGFGNTGYIFPNFVQMQRGGRSFNPIPPQVELNVPYFSQRDNPRLYWSTCNVTSIAMVFYYYGVRSKDGGQLEDELLQWCLDRYGAGSQTDHSVLIKLIEAYGFKSQFSTTYKWQDIKEELMNRRPVVLCGYFTHGGHIVTVVGYTPQGYIVNDPWGDGYYGYASTEGRKLIYPYDYTTQMCGVDGDVWAHFIRKA
ncbi:C39 family peptidase [Alkalinema pantanalense CENA528]|uniref:C39 family peptidase n=1 Tax=Alkalinema pantanalense TaxID=1620705 RepID=UPI003D6F4396